MELRALEYFVAVAEERHFTRAAARIPVSQSGLSAVIRTLEAELHTPLFERTTRRVRLTPAGEALLPDARRALAAARAGADAVAAVQGLQRGRITLGLMQRPGLVGLPRILVNYHRRHPQVELHLRQESAADLVQLVLGGELDLAIASPPQRRDNRLTVVELLRTPMVLACRADDDLATRASVNIRALSQQNVIGYPRGWANRSLADQMLSRADLSIEPNLEINDTATLLDLIEAGLGIAILAAALITQRRQLSAVPIRPAAYWTISAITATPAPTNPAARELWTQITANHERPIEPAGRSAAHRRR
ncbi:MAG TPA: LysR family transcriptional regulator [Mycobacterium sp.]|jgi:DNA-binding transcriptional LysR family regulator|nr:LysR family transcriptional regulator [Mycobacterium sp.]